MKKILIFSIFFLVLVLNTVSASVNDTDIKNFVNNINVEFNKISNDKSTNQKQKKQKFNSFTSTIIDTDWMSKFILGKHYKELNDTQRKDFNVDYKKYLISNYMAKLQDFNMNLEVKNITQKKENAYLVNCITKDQNGKNIIVDFRLSVKNDKIYIIDIIPEGISFIGSQRTEIDTAISQLGFDKFMKDLKNKNAKMN